ncbi:MAG TPA: Ig-like domain-containing protein, partial [Anaerolineae bacterium]
MDLKTNLRFVLLTSAWLFAVTACTPVAAPPPGGKTATVASAVETPALVSFPTTAPETATPMATASITSTLTSQSALVSIPIVQLVSPISNTQVSISQTTFLIAYAADDNGIARIEFYDDSTLVGTETAPSPAPTVFSASVPWTPADLGSHLVRVIAYDTTNRASAPEDMTVSVTPDTRRPTATILYPLGTPQLELGTLLQIQAAAIDEVGVTQLDLYVDNQIAVYVTSPNAGGQSPFPTVFTWPALTPGAHTLFIRAHDNQDQTNDSAPLRVQVVDSHNPAISIAFD